MVCTSSVSGPPSAWLLWALSTPVWTKVVPWYWLVSARPSVPAPILVSADDHGPVTVPVSVSWLDSAVLLSTAIELLVWRLTAPVRTLVPLRFSSAPLPVVGVASGASSVAAPRPAGAV